MRAIEDEQGVKRYLITLNINDQLYTKAVKANTLLANFLRDELNLTGTKDGCESGDCGSCTVLMDGKPVNSCLILAIEAEGHEIITTECLEEQEEPDVIQEFCIENDAVQCGYCTPGMIMSVKALLDKNPHPTGHVAREAIAGNLCRCTVMPTSSMRLCLQLKNS